MASPLAGRPQTSDHIAARVATRRANGRLGVPPVHGHARRGHTTPEYKAWEHAKYRCMNPKAQAWHRYGGRGIRMADVWLNNFEAFLQYIGPRPSAKHSLDRIDNDGDYAPGNVRWATRKEQARNGTHPGLRPHPENLIPGYKGRRGPHAKHTPKDGDTREP